MYRICGAFVKSGGHSVFLACANNRFCAHRLTDRRFWRIQFGTAFRAKNVMALTVAPGYRAAYSNPPVADYKLIARLCKKYPLSDSDDIRAAVW